MADTCSKNQNLDPSVEIESDSIFTSDAAPPYSDHSMGYGQALNGDSVQEGSRGSLGVGAGNNISLPPYQPSNASASQKMPPTITSSTASNSTVVISHPQRWVPVITVERVEPFSRPTRDPERIVIGEWPWGTHHVNGRIQTALAYHDQLPQTMFCLLLLTIVLFILGTPLSLLCTLSALYWLCQVKQSVKDDDIPRAKQSFKYCYRISIASVGCSFVIFAVAVPLLIFLL